MTRPYSEDLRERALARFAAGETIRAIGQALGIDPSCVPKWVKRKRETGGCAGSIGGRKPRTLSGETAAWLRERLQSGPFTTRGLTAELADRGVKTDRRAVGFRSRGRSELQKKPCSPASRIARRRAQTRTLEGASGQRRSHAPCLHRRDLGEDKHDAATGLGPQGPQARVKSSPWTLEDVDLHCGAAMRPDRCATRYRRTYQRRALRRLCRAGSRSRHSPKATSSCSTISAPTGAARARPAIRAAGAHLLFLPPYSPDLNPIEQVFAKLKHGRRAAAERTVEDTGPSSAPPSPPSRPANAPTISEIQDMLPYENSTL